MQYYTFKKLQEKLKEKGIPNSRPYITALEKENIIITPMSSLRFHQAESEITYQRQDIRIYTIEEINLIIAQIEKLRQ